MTILLVEDDPGIGRFVVRGLEQRGYRVQWERQAANVAALDAARGFSTIVLDLGLPDGDGLDVARDLRSGGSRTPILMLTARGALQDRLDGFDCGADDYLPKPFAFAELLARLAVLVRRAGERAPEPVRCGALTVQPGTRTAAVDGAALELSRREFDLLAALAGAGGAVVPRAELAAAMWGEADAVNDNTLDVYIGYVRRRLADHAAAPVIETLRRRGFRLVQKHDAT
ncbi:response regulator transcription factor [Sphingomonas immobilis]|uniref:Response regulator transcription factor n=1 Tax=Sphingomonas immobilis TaxID=3063997 RepID=A0ABT9A2Z6_9SPHN|nr:response regulator transcription factor [Sphingomonas sp. CA1-15]MDO7843918.1 response regulator transcription factor [Sphingomonas sp. CA1-15]